MTPISCPPFVTPPAAIGKEPSSSSCIAFARVNYPLGRPALHPTRIQEASSDWPITRSSSSTRLSIALMQSSSSSYSTSLDPVLCSRCCVLPIEQNEARDSLRTGSRCNKSFARLMQLVLCYFLFFQWPPRLPLWLQHVKTFVHGSIDVFLSLNFAIKNGR